MTSQHTPHDPDHSGDKQRENNPNQKPGGGSERREGEPERPGQGDKQHAPGQGGQQPTKRSEADSESEILRVPSLDPLAGNRFAPDAGAPEIRTPRHLGTHEWRDEHEARNREAVATAREGDEWRRDRGQLPNDETRKRDEAQARDAAKADQGDKGGGKGKDDDGLKGIADAIAKSDADARGENDESIPPGAGSWPIPNDPAVIDPLGHLDDLPGIVATPAVAGAGMPGEAPTDVPAPLLPRDFEGKASDVPAPTPSHAPERAPRSGPTEQHPPDRPQAERMDAPETAPETKAPAPTKKGM